MSNIYVRPIEDSYSGITEITLAGRVSIVNAGAVAIKIMDPDDNLVTIAQAAVSDKGYKEKVTIGGPKYTKEGSYIISLHYGDSKVRLAFQYTPTNPND